MLLKLEWRHFPHEFFFLGTAWNHFSAYWNSVVRSINFVSSLTVSREFEAHLFVKSTMKKISGNLKNTI